MIGIIRIASGVDGLSIDFGVDRLSVSDICGSMSLETTVHGHLLVSRIFNIERCYLSVHGHCLIWLNVSVELRSY